VNSQTIAAKPRFSDGFTYPHTSLGNQPGRTKRLMKKKPKGAKVDDLRSEYNLHKLLRNGVQGKYADRFREETNLALLDENLAENGARDGSENSDDRI
jgi:hypothetical protein